MPGARTIYESQTARAREGSPSLRQRTDQCRRGDTHGARAFLPLTRAFAGVRRSRCSSRHSGNDKIGRCGFPLSERDRLVPTASARGRQSERAAWLPEARGVKRGRVAVRGEGVQFWLKPGEAAVTLGTGEERREERIPARLRRFLGGLPIVPAVGSGKTSTL